MVAQVSDYTVQKIDRGWGLFLNGSPALTKYNHPYTFKRKRDAVEEIPKIVSRAEYVERIQREDREGMQFTKDEEREIHDYAEVLKANKSLRTLWGTRTPVEKAIKQHHDDSRAIESWYRSGLGEPWPRESYGNLICAEIRRRKAMRIAALIYADVEWDRNRYELTITPTHREGTEPCAYIYNSLAEVEEAKQDVLRCKTDKESYEFSVRVVKPGWPTDHPDWVG